MNVWDPQDEPRRRMPWALIAVAAAMLAIFVVRMVTR